MIGRGAGKGSSGRGAPGRGSGKGGAGKGSSGKGSPGVWSLVSRAEEHEVLERYSVNGVPVAITVDGRYLVDEPRMPAGAEAAYSRIFRHMSRSEEDDDPGGAAENKVLRALSRSAQMLRLEGALRDNMRAMSYYAVRDAAGFRIIDVPMKDGDVEDITYVGGAAPVKVLHRRHPEFYFMSTNIRFEPPPPPGAQAAPHRSADVFTRTLMQAVGKYASSASPYAEGSTPGRDRLSAFAGTEITPDGAAFTVRRFPSGRTTIADLVAGGVMAPGMAAYVWAALAGGGTGLIVGGTGSGKTTVLNALLSLVNKRWKVVVIEDTEELRPPQECSLRLRTREPADSFGGRRIGMGDLLSYTLRQRPQCVVVGEVRLADVPILFQVFEAGHAALATFHGAGPSGAMRRLEARPIEIMAAQKGDLWFLLHAGAALERGVLRRRVLSLVETALEADGTVSERTLASYDPAAGRFEGASAAEVARKSGRLAAAAAAGGIADHVSDMADREKFLEGLAAGPAGERPDNAGIMELASRFAEGRAMAGRPKKEWRAGRVL